MSRSTTPLREIAPLDEAFASHDIKRRYNRRMFGVIADRYDFFTRFFSGGRDRGWKDELMSRMNVQPGWRVLDLACGTGDLTFDAARRGARAVGLDLTTRMLELAKKKAEHALSNGHAGEPGSVSVDAAARVGWTVGDMAALPLTSASFDLVTTGYGLRNVADLPRAIGEIHRVLKPGGTFGSLDFDRPDNTVVRAIYLGYLHAMGSAVGWALHRDADTYRYISASLRRYPGSDAVAGMLRAAGFVDVQVIALLGGLMAIHIAKKPSA